MKSLSSIIILLAIMSSCEHVTYQQGEALYENNCARCHMPDASGVGDLYPSLNALGKTYDYNVMACIIKYGKDSDVSVLEMIGLKELSDVEINNIVNYIRSDINKAPGQMTIVKTRELLSQCK